MGSDFQRAPERRLSFYELTVGQQRSSVDSPCSRNIRILIESLLERGCRGLVIFPGKLRCAHQNTGNGGISVADHAIDHRRALLGLPILDQRSPEDVFDCPIVRMSLVSGLDQRNRVPELPQPQVAVGQQVEGLLIGGMELVQLIELALRHAEISPLVQRESQIQSRGFVPGVSCEHLLILLHRFVGSSFLRESDTQIGAGFDRIGSTFQQLIIELDGLRGVSCIESLSGLVVEGLQRDFLGLEPYRAERRHRNSQEQNQPDSPCTAHVNAPIVDEPLSPVGRRSAILREPVNA